MKIVGQNDICLDAYKFINATYIDLCLTQTCVIR